MFAVYLSSTLNDLREERSAVKEVLSDECVIKHSYQASEDALVKSCLDDVAKCTLYIGVLGLRYGHIPGGNFHNPDQLSITELEYRHAGNKRIPRHIYLKDESAIPFSLTDATGNGSMERINAFRSLVSADQRPFLFKSTSELREAALKAFHALNAKRVGATTPERPTRLGTIDVDNDNTSAVHFTNQAIIRFTLTNLSEFQLKAHLYLSVDEARPSQSIRLRKAGAILQEFELCADFRNGAEIDLLAETSVQIVLAPRESDAFRLALRGEEGMLYRCRLIAEFRNLLHNDEQRIDSMAFYVDFPIRSTKAARRNQH